MKRLFKGLGVAVLALALLAGERAAWKHEEITRPMAVSASFHEDQVNRADIAMFRVIVAGLSKHGEAEGEG